MLTVYLLDHHRKAAQRLKHMATENGRVEKVLHFTGTDSLMESCLIECPGLVIIRLGETLFNGLKIADKVALLYRSLPVAFITRHPQYAALAWEAGAAGFLTEPLQNEQFIQLLERLG
jgi:FixJ family two-component response regulator